MKLQNAARSILSITAVAWGIPFAHASDSAITAKVKAALLLEPKVDSLDVSVETYKGGVLLSGFVKDEAQRRQAVRAAAAVSGVTSVKDGMAVR